MVEMANGKACSPVMLLPPQNDGWRQDPDGARTGVPRPPTPAPDRAAIGGNTVFSELPYRGWSYSVGIVALVARIFYSVAWKKRW